MTRATLVGAVALSLALALTACDPGDDPTDPPTDSSTQTTTDDPTTDESPEPTEPVATPPELDQPVPPEEIRIDDRAGAAAAVEYFFASLDYARTTGDIGQLEGLSGRDCSYCEFRLESIENLHADGGWAEPHETTLDEVRVQFPDSDNPSYLVRFALQSPQLTVHAGDGSVQLVEASQAPSFAAEVEWVGGAFRIGGVDEDTSD